MVCVFEPSDNGKSIWISVVTETIKYFYGKDNMVAMGVWHLKILRNKKSFHGTIKHLTKGITSYINLPNVKM